MIFCKHCGTYSNKGILQCSKCNADLSAFGHETMSGSAIIPQALSTTRPASSTPVIGAGSFEFGGFGYRLLAMILDSVILSVATVVPTVLVIAALIGTDPQRLAQQAGTALWLFVAGFGIIMLAPIAYDILMIAKKGATFGKSILKLSVVRTNGEPVSLGRCVLRTVVKMFVSGFLLIGYLLALFTSKKQTLHDLLADTIVVRTSN